MRRLRNLWWVMVLTPAILLADRPPSYVVQTSQLSQLAEYASAHFINLTPLLTYPNPSPRTLDLFGDFYVLEFPGRSTLEVTTLTSEIINLPGVTYCQVNGRFFPIPGWQEDASGVTPFHLPDTSFDEPYIPNDPLFPEQWDKPITGAHWAWNLTTGDTVVIAFIDTGVDTMHEDLNPNIVPGWNFAFNSDNVLDQMGHGTTVCGVAAAKIDNGLGIAGVAGDADIMMLRVADTRWVNSNYGDRVDIYAPGGKSTRRNGGYNDVIHTSFTTPQIAGLAALILDAYPHGTNEEVWDLIINTADTIASDVGPILRMDAEEAVLTGIPDPDTTPEIISEDAAEPFFVTAPEVQTGEIRLLTNCIAPYCVEICDVSGRRVFSHKDYARPGSILLNPELASGVYFWRLSSVECFASGKFVYLK